MQIGQLGMPHLERRSQVEKRLITNSVVIKVILRAKSRVDIIHHLAVDAI
jgi:hypothetical protein